MAPQLAALLMVPLPVASPPQVQQGEEEGAGEGLQLLWERVVLPQEVMVLQRGRVLLLLGEEGILGQKMMGEALRPLGSPALIPSWVTGALHCPPLYNLLPHSVAACDGVG